MKKTLFLSLGAVFVAGFLHAQDTSGQWGVSGTAQAAFPLGQQSVKDQAEKVGPLLGGMVSYGLNSHWSVGASYENIDHRNHVRVEPILIQAIHRCLPDRQWTPVATLGVGASRGVDVKNFNHLAAKAAIGLDYFPVPYFALGPQISYHYVSEIDDSVRHLHSLGAGMVASYFFGGSSSAPAPKPVAVAPAPPVAQAPVDTDGDGVVDSKDQCPDTPAGALVDANGCPQKPPTEKVTIELKVFFDTAKAIVKPEFNSEIKQVADFMRSYPSVQAQIEGHTDSVGSVAMNTSLSQRRADAVREELIKTFGVDASRLTAKGFGPSQPIADNATAEGRAKNRRVIATITAVKN